jgi:STE24 endopeptidase
MHKQRVCARKFERGTGACWALAQVMRWLVVLVAIGLLRVPASSAETRHPAASYVLHFVMLGQANDSQPSQQQAKASDNATTQARARSEETQEFHLSQERYEKAVAYSRAGYLLYFVSVGWGILVLLILLKAGVVAKWRDFAEARSRNWIVQGLIFVPVLSLCLGVAQLPISACWHSLSLKYAQSVERWGPWLWDWTKGEVINVVFGVVGAVILFAVIRKAPRRWWLLFWLVSIPLVLFVVLITPLVLDPMFHKFMPLQQTDPELVASIEKLTQRAGEPIPPNRMFLMEASEKTNEINAYVTGIGTSKRLVIWDNTIKKMSPDEVLSVVGHEMGHYVLGHVTEGIAFGLLGLLVALFLIYRALHWVLRLCGEAWGVRGQADWAALPVLLLIGGVLAFLAEPIGNGFSRRIEHAADVFGLEVIHGIVPNAQEAAAHSFQVMGELDLADPNPPHIITLWLYSHPPLAERLKFARNYDPWAQGKAPKYVK